jgi:hypothetical protein
MFYPRKNQRGTALKYVGMQVHSVDSQILHEEEEEESHR